MGRPDAIIADDEEQLRTYLKSKLNRLWPELTICGEAANGLEALELIEASRPAIAFLDIKMPGLTGIEVARKLDAHCHVVFITAFDQFAVEAVVVAQQGLDIGGHGPGHVEQRGVLG